MGETNIWNVHDLPLPLDFLKVLSNVKYRSNIEELNIFCEIHVACVDYSVTGFLLTNQENENLEYRKYSSTEIVSFSWFDSNTLHAAVMLKWQKKVAWKKSFLYVAI